MSDARTAIAIGLCMFKYSARRFGPPKPGILRARRRAIKRAIKVLQKSLFRGLIGFKPRHFQDYAERVEAVALGDLGQLAGECSYIMCGRIRSLSPVRTVGVVPVRHYLFATQFFGARPRWQGSLAEFA
jgi:hypothetical protein